MSRSNQQSKYDVVVVGAGHNGLTAAAYLAKAGRKVLVVERRGVVGGLAAGEEFHPGYRSTGLLHDTSAVRRFVADDLGLASHGLRFRDRPAPVFVPQVAGPGLLLDHDPERAAQELARHSARDAESYRAFRAFIDRIDPVIRRLLDRPPPDIFEPGLGDLVTLGRAGLSLRLLGERDMMELLRIAPMCVADYLGEWFESQLVRAALAGPAIFSTFTGPWSPGSNLNFLLDAVLDRSPVVGGPQALVDALERAARGFGVEIRTGTAVESLLLDGGRVKGVRLADGDEGGEEIREEITASVVAASCDPKTLFLDLLPVGSNSMKAEQNIVHLRTRGTVAKVHLALSDYPEWSARPGLRPSSIRTGETVDDLERAFDAVKYRQMSERPVLDLHVPTVDQPELAPDGHHVASILVSFVPYDLGRGSTNSGWTDEARQTLYRRTLDALKVHAPDIEELVVGHEVLSPADIERRYGATQGHLHHGEHSIDQLVVRPSPECARYAAPFAGLFLCGSGSHPGGGVTCAPGALAARTILRSKNA